MRKLALAAGLVALATTSPALAEGRGKGSSFTTPAHSQAAPAFSGSFKRVILSIWGAGFNQPPGFASPGKHWGWFKGKHWGWFKPKHPHWPHDPPVSP